jgi:hypothetical protein
MKATSSREQGFRGCVRTVLVWGRVFDPSRRVGDPPPHENGELLRWLKPAFSLLFHAGLKACSTQFMNNVILRIPPSYPIESVCGHVLSSTA